MPLHFLVESTRALSVHLSYFGFGFFSRLVLSIHLQSVAHFYLVVGRQTVFLV